MAFLYRKRLDSRNLEKMKSQLHLDVVFENSNIVFIEWPEKLEGIEADIDINIVLSGKKRQIVDHFNNFK